MKKSYQVKKERHEEYYEDVPYFVCDRCGTEMQCRETAYLIFTHAEPQPDEFGRVTAAVLSHNISQAFAPDKHLCAKCLDEFSAFMSGEKVEAKKEETK